jgi:hypothetical protein
MTEKLTLPIGALLRAGRICEVTLPEIAAADDKGLERARAGFNSALSNLVGVLDADMGHELSTLLPALGKASTSEVMLAYAGLTGWVSGILQGGISIEVDDDEDAAVVSVARNGMYL